jgi:hypothetical protein
MNQVREVSLGDGVGDVAVKVNGATVEVHADGSVAAHTSGEVDVYTNASVRVHPAENDSAKAGTIPPAELKPGDGMEDGTIYAGVSPDTGRPMYTTPVGAPLTMKWKHALGDAAALNAHGHQDWRVPSKGELNVLFNNRAAIGGFDESGSYPGGWYWSSTASHGDAAWGQRFSVAGAQYVAGEGHKSSLRCVRG